MQANDLYIYEPYYPKMKTKLFKLSFLFLTLFITINIDTNVHQIWCVVLNLYIRILMKEIFVLFLSC